MNLIEIEATSLRYNLQEIDIDHWWSTFYGILSFFMIFFSLFRNIENMMMHHGYSLLALIWKISSFYTCICESNRLTTCCNSSFSKFIVFSYLFSRMHIHINNFLCPFFLFTCFTVFLLQKIENDVTPDQKSWSNYMVMLLSFSNFKHSSYIHKENPVHSC